MGSDPSVVRRTQRQMHEEHKHSPVSLLTGLFTTIIILKSIIINSNKVTKVLFILIFYVYNLLLYICVIYIYIYIYI